MRSKNHPRRALVALVAPAWTSLLGLVATSASPRGARRGCRSSSILTLMEKDSPVKDLLPPSCSKTHLLLPLGQRQEWLQGVCTHLAS